MTWRFGHGGATCCERSDFFLNRTRTQDEPSVVSVGLLAGKTFNPIGLFVVWNNSAGSQHDGIAHFVTAVVERGCQTWARGSSYTRHDCYSFALLGYHFKRRWVMIVRDHVGSMLSHAPLGGRVLHQRNSTSLCKHSKASFPCWVPGL